MAWESRRGAVYYYRKQRRGGRVVSVYAGTGEAAEAVAAQDAAAQLHRDRLRGMQAEEQALDQELDKLAGLTRDLAAGLALVGGYYSHKGQWRKRSRG